MRCEQLQKFEEKNEENVSQFGAKMLFSVFDEKRENEQIKLLLLLR